MTAGQPDVTAAPVVVGVDGSEGSQRALRWAAEYARMSGAPLQAVMAWDLPTNYGMPANYDDVDFTKEAEARLEQTLAAVGDLGAVQQRVEQGHPAAVLVSASDHARLLVIGSHGHGAFAASLLGSVSHKCIHHAQCPVVVVREKSNT